MRSANLTNSRFFSLLWLLLLASLTTTASAQIRPADIDDLLGLSGSQLIELDIPDELGGYLEVAVPIEGKLEILELIPRSVRAADFLIQSTDDNGKTIFTDPGPVRTFRGVVYDHKGSDVAGALHIEGLWAHIVLADGSSYWIEPLAERFPGFRREDHVVYRGDQVLPSDWFCGVNGTAQGSPLPGMVGGTGCNGDFCIADIGIDADFAFFTNYFSSVVRSSNRIELVMNIVNQQYERDVQITHRIVTPIIVRTVQGNQANPPDYTNNGGTAVPNTTIGNPCFAGNNLLAALNTAWNTPPLDVVDRDLVHLFTGTTNGLLTQNGNPNNGADANGDGCDDQATSNFIGLANQPGICATNQYGWSQSDWNANLALSTDLTAHELGHNWNAPHCLNEAIPNPPPCSNPPFTMNANILGSNRFRTTIRNTIQTFRDSLGNCLDSGVNNDNCRDALPVCIGTYTGTTAGATQDGSTDCGTNADLDVWYRFTPESNGNVTFTVFELTGGFPFVLSVHDDGCPGSSSNEIDCDLGSTAEVTVPVTAGVTILIRIAVTNGSVAGNFFLVVGGTNDCAPPINDDCASPIDICPGEYIGTTDGASGASFDVCDGISVGGPVPITNAQPANSTVALASSITNITNVDVAMIVFHPAIAELTINITSPNGTTVTLHNNTPPVNTPPLPPENTIRVIYDDNGIANGAQAFNNVIRMQPSGPGVLANFNGLSANGNWQISVSDNAAGNDGILLGWTLSVTGTGPPANFTPDVWYRYTPLAGTTILSDWMVIDTCDSDFDTVIELYDAQTTPCPGTLLTCSNNNYCGTGDQLAWQVLPGESYLIRVSGAAGASGAFRLGLSGPQCVNDLCVGATVIDSGTHFGTLDGASNDGTSGTGGGDPLCGSSDNTPDVYYSFTAPCGGTFFANTCGSKDMFGLDSVLSIHSTPCPADSTTLLDCNDDSTICAVSPGSFLDSFVSTPVTRGQIVIIRVSHFGGSSSDPNPFILNVGVIPGNDVCSVAFDVSSGGNFTGDTRCATTDGSTTCAQTSADVWYQFTASCNGTLQVDTCGTHDLNGPDTGIDTVLSLHGSCPGTDLNELDCNDDWFSSSDPTACSGSDTLVPRDSFVSLEMSEGETVFIRVSAFLASIGPGIFNLNVNFVENFNPPHSLRNGDFSSAGNHWCFDNQNSSGFRSFEFDAAQIFSADAGEGAIFTNIHQTFTTFDTQSHRVRFDWDWFPAGPNDDQARWDLIDVATGLSVVGGPILLSNFSTQNSGTVNTPFSGSGPFSGNYNLQIGTFTAGGLGGTGMTDFDNIAIDCDNSPGPLTNADFSDPSGSPWCFTDRSDSGSVDYSSGQAVISGGDDGITAASFISQLIDLPSGELQLSFSWSFATPNDGTDLAIFQLFDPNGDLVTNDIFLSSTNGENGHRFVIFDSPGGSYELNLGTYSPNDIGGAGVATFDDIVIQAPSCPAVSGLDCTESAVAVLLEWTNGGPYSEIQIYSDLSGLIATIDGDQTSFFHNFPPQGTSTYWVVGVCGSLEASPSNTCTTSVCPRVEPLTCNVYGSQVFLVWNNPANYTTIQIRLGTLVIATLIGNKNQYLFDAPGPGTYTLCVVGFCGGVEADATCCEVTIGSTEQEFIRGNCNLSGDIDIADVISLLSSLFNGVPLGNCADACDANDDGALDIADGITLLSFLFIGADPPPPPFPDCGPDPTPDPLDCESFPACP